MIVSVGGDSVTVDEKVDSGNLVDSASPTAELLYLAHGTTSQFNADVAVKTASPSSLGSLQRREVRIQPYEGRSDWWLGAVSYGRYDPVYTFDTSGGTKHITQSMSTRAVYAPAGVTPNDHKGAIGVTTDGNVEGCDITVPVYHWTETHWLPSSTVTTTYKKNVADMTGCTNYGTFRGMPQWSVLFLGARGSQRGTEDWEISFEFAYSQHYLDPNYLPDIGDISDIEKRGWDYLWVEYGEQAGANGLEKYPKAVYTERVYQDADFSVLGIGTT